MISDYQRYRLYEILPGLSIWLTIIFGLVFSFLFPLFMMYVVIVFDIYWVLRVLYFSFYIVFSWNRFRQAIKKDWFAMLAKEYPAWEGKINVIFLPVYNESWEVIQTTLDAIRASSYPAQKLYIVLSGEERKIEHWKGLQGKVLTTYKEYFADVICYTHPDGLPGEIPGKGSNIHSAEKQFKVYADQKGWRYENVIISVFDVDTVVHPEYFAHLNYMYCRHPRPERSSFQPITLYNNNIWDSPAVLRIMAFGTSFWMLFSLARLEHLVTFSSHSMSFKAALECGGHAKDIVSEDSRIFFQCWLHYDGDYEVTPLYIPVSMDTVRDDSIIVSLKNLYLQQRRWAWGTENIPYLLWQYRLHPKLSKWKKTIMLFHEWEGKWSWAAVTIIITILSRLPLWFAGNDVRQSVLFFNTPQILGFLMTLAMAGLLVSTIMSMLLLPPRPEHHPKHMYIFMVLQWVLVPVSLFLFSSLPCIDAVTHLMRGKYLGFNVSTKKRAQVPTA